LPKPAKVRGIRLLVDRGYQLNALMKENSKELNRIKAKLKQHAEATGNPFISGNKHEARVDGKSYPTVHPDVAWVEAGRNIDKFLRIVKIPVEALLRELGGDARDIISYRYNEFNTVRFLNGGDGDGKTARPLRKIDI